MAIAHFRELIAWQLADALETEVIRLLQAHPKAWKDFKYRDQILDALTGIPSHIAEGFTRRSPRETCRFLDYALSCLSEVEVWLASGVKRGHFNIDNCAGAIRLIRRTSKATLGFKRSQQQYLARTSAGRGSKRPLSDGAAPMKPPEPEKEKRQPKKPEETG